MGMSIEKVDDSRRSTAMGLHQSVYAVGMFAGPWLSGILAKAMGIQPMFGWSTAAFLGLATFNMWAMREKTQITTDQHG
jgi:predicted MFS family arabinose efflux permease